MKLALALYLFVLGFTIYFSFHLPLGSDEGTHLLLSMFYRDLIISLPKLGFDLKRMYEFGVRYLVNYPKLTITYLPLYHLHLSLLPTPIIGRLISIFYAFLSSALLYTYSKRITESLLLPLLFLLLPTSAQSMLWVSMDHLSFFLLFLTIYLFFKTLKSGGKWSYPFLGALCFLSFFSKIFLVFPILSITTYLLLFERRKLKDIFGLLVTFFIPFGIFIFCYHRVGALEASKYIIREAETMPWVNYTIAPIYYFLHLAKQTFGLGLVIPLFFFHYLFKNWKCRKAKFLAIWFFYSTPILCWLQNPRYVTYFLLPCFFTLPYYWKKWRGLFLMLIMIFLVIFLVQGLNSLAKNRGFKELQAKISLYAASKGSRIGILSEEPIFSSIYMYWIATNDGNKSYTVWRPCFFVEMENFTREVEENGIEVIIATKPHKNYPIVNDIKGMKLERVFKWKGQDIEVFTLKHAKKKKSCNYICVTRYYICTNLDSPFQVFETSPNITIERFD